MGILAARRALYVALAILLYGTIGTAAAAIHVWRHGYGEEIFVWERVAALVWPVVASVYLIGLYVAAHQAQQLTLASYLSPVSPRLWAEIRALRALFLSGVFCLGYYTRYKLTACGSAETSDGPHKRYVCGHLQRI